jgi:tetratricopeptide (TPR) repeat protein
VKGQLVKAKSQSLEPIKQLQLARAQGRLDATGEGILAEALNNYAWLVCNTEGDFEKALECSLQSVEIRADSARLDTCGRCYFAVGDFDNAIRVQKRALALEPHSPPLKRQLREFEQAKKKAEVAAENAKAN